MRKYTSLVLFAIFTGVAVVAIAGGFKPKPMDDIMRHCTWHIIRPGTLPAMNIQEFEKAMKKDDLVSLELRLRDGTTVTLVRTNLEDRWK